MREIKFRAYVKSYSIMVFDVVDIYDDKLHKDGKYYGCLGDVLDDDDVIIEQFTGMRDKNGRDIYEGDILDGNIVVGWSDYYASFSLNSKGFAFTHFFGEAIDAHDLLVIGNIHENPELLK